jgi:hypothetical protein
MVLCGSAFGLIDCYDSTKTTTDIPVPDTDVVYSAWFECDYGEYAAVCYMISSDDGVADVTIQLQQSPINPSLAGVSDPDGQIPVNMADIVTALTTEDTWYYKSLSLLPLPWARFKLTGIGSNESDTVVNIKVSQMKSLNAR